jgi:hypothetical protein
MSNHTSPWIMHVAALTLLICFYCVGVRDGRTHQYQIDHPTTHQK